jgi:RNA recognition motif-containing protein
VRIAALKFSGVAEKPVGCAQGRDLSACLCWPQRARRRSPPSHPLTLAGSTNQEAGLNCRFIPFIREYSSVTKLYVGNLPFTATDEAVRALFSKHGTVEKVTLIVDRDTGRPRGFGFVEMSNADASRAMQALNATDFDGRSLKVSEAQERERSGGGGRGGPRRY